MASNMCKIDINLTKQVNDAIITMLLKKGGNEFLMKKDDKASISLRKVISISIILLFIMEIGVMAANSKLNSVKIILSDGYEMDVLTSKTKISEILDENHIILLPNEKVIPGSEEEISDNKTIKITKNASASETQNTEVVSEELSMDKVLSNFSENDPVRVVLGHMSEKILNDIDLMVISPGIPVDSEIANVVRDANIPIWSETDFEEQLKSE